MPIRQEIKEVIDRSPEILCLCRCALSANEVNDIADYLKTNITLTRFDLNDNDIGDEGAKAIADALKTNKSVTNVNLSNNKIGDDGAKAIADALKANKTVISISLAVNYIGVEGIKALYAAGWNAGTCEITRAPESNLNKFLNFVENHKGKFVLAGVAACAIVAYYKKPELLPTNLLKAFFEKASGFIIGK